MESATTSKSGIDYEISSPVVFASHPLVSVIMLAYNHGNYIAKAIEGVLSQANLFPIELLIGEDCSTDATREIAVHYQKLNAGIVRVITADTNVGSLANSRRVLAAARGDFIAYLDGDDYWLPGKLEKQLTFLRSNACCAAVYTNALTMDRQGNHVGVFNDAGDLRIDLAGLLSHGNFFCNSSMVYRASARTVLLEITQPSIDFQAHLTLARLGWLAQLGEPLTVYRINSSGSMVAQANDHVRELYWQAIQSVPRELVSDAAYASGIADFLRRVFFRAVHKWRWSLLQKWAPRVCSASPYGRSRTLLLTCCSIARITFLECMGLFRRNGSGRRLKVLYRR